MVSAIVIGAGIVGSPLAYELTKAGVKTTLIDRGLVAELGASRWGFGGVSWASATTPATIEFSRRGFARYFELAGELGQPIGFRPNEGLVLQQDTPAFAHARELVAEFCRRGHGARLIGPGELAQLEPALNCRGWAGAMGLQQGHLDLQQCARAYVQQGQQLGLTVHEGIEVTALCGDGGRVETSLGTLSADLVLLAAGAWARPLLRRAGIDLPVFHSHAEFLASEPMPPLLRHQISWGGFSRANAEDRSMAPEHLDAWRNDLDTELVPNSREIALVQYAGGHIRIGQVSRLLPVYRDRPQERTREILLDGARQLLPAVAALPGLTLHTRAVAFTADHLPVVGPLPGLPQAVLVAVSTSPTVMAPAIAAALAAHAARGDWDPLLNEWALDRPAVKALTQQLREPAAPMAV